MITDAQLTFSSAQAVTASAASANQVDLNSARSLERTGAGSLRIVATVTTAFAGVTSVQARVRQASNAGMSTGVDVIYTGPVVPVANLTKGAVLLDIPFPGVESFGADQYIDVDYVVVGGPGSAGAVWAGVVMNSEGGERRLGVTGR